MTKSNNWETRKRNFYIQDEKPVHKLSYCAFLDVLGFSARTTESYKSGSADKLLGEFHEVFTETTEELRRDANFEYSRLYYKSFSDNVLLAVPITSRDMESEFGNILIATSRYQFRMALRGFFIRGGLSVGPLFIDDNSVYGEALLAAYRLESQIALNPVVALCDETAKLVRKHLTYYADDWAPQLRSLLINADGRYFINYLDECVIVTNDDDVLDTESLDLHKQQIEQALTSYANNIPVFAKFSWLSAYHNYFCDSVSNFEGYTESLKVSTELATVKFFCLPPVKE